MKVVWYVILRLANSFDAQMCQFDDMQCIHHEQKLKYSEWRTVGSAMAENKETKFWFVEWNWMSELDSFTELLL